MIRGGVLVIVLGMIGRSAHATDQPLYGPPPAWVRPVAVPFDVKSSGGAIDVLLWTTQDRLAPGDDESFVEVAERVNTPEGLGGAGSLAQTWNPLTESLTIHRAQILRGGKTIDLLADGRRFTVLRRETNLEASVIDGELTATLQPEGLQVGDVLDFAYTLVTREPALAGHSEGGAQVAHLGTVARLSVHASWLSARTFRTWESDDLPALVRTTSGGWTDVGFEQLAAVSPEPPKGAPSFERRVGVLTVADFESWRDVSRTVHPLYAKAAVLAPDSPLLAEVLRIRATNATPKARALAALEFVESQTRYLFVGLDAGGYTPAAADLTWKRRFGDCKGKAVLLLALLQELGVAAEPALVDTSTGDGLDRQLPQMSAFDHVIVRATIDGAVYWLDATRQGDENLDVLTVPNVHWALPLRADGAELEPLTPKDPVLPLLESKLDVDARSGIDHPAHVHQEIITRGDAALALSLGMRQASKIDADRALREGFTAGRNWIKPDKVEFSYDPQRMEARAVMEGSGIPPFVSASGATSGVREWPVAGPVARDADLTRSSDYHRDAPFAVVYPLYVRSVVVVDLPDGGKGFEAAAANGVNRTVAGVDYNQVAAIVNGRFNASASYRAIASLFPASAAAAAELELRSLSQYGVAIRYTPTPTAVKTTSASRIVGVRSLALSMPRDANPEEAAQTAYAAKDYAGAEAGFTEAIKLHSSAKLYYDRAAARAALGRDAAARGDMVAALALDPKDLYVLLALGRLALRHGDSAEAASRFAAAQAASLKHGSTAETIAQVYEVSDHYAEAVPYRDRIVAEETSPDQRASVLNNACWTRARAGMELPRALHDCDMALSLQPAAANILDSRGLVNLRSGDLKNAVADYDAALSKRPGIPASLFGRALAEGRLGLLDKAKTDSAAAAKIDPAIEATFARWGLHR